jgi:hypothetical protein
MKKRDYEKPMMAVIGVQSAQMVMTSGYDIDASGVSALRDDYGVTQEIEWN